MSFMSCNAAAVRSIENDDTLPAPPNKDLQVCSCCCRVIDDVLWESWPTLGLMEDGDGGFLDLRNCACGTTLSRVAKREIRGFEVA